MMSRSLGDSNRQVDRSQLGVAFREAIRKTGWGGLEQDDIRTGIEAMIARGIAAPGRVGITGTSYGGYSSWCRRSEEHTSELQSHLNLVCRLLLEKKKKKDIVSSSNRPMVYRCIS